MKKMVITFMIFAIWILAIPLGVQAAQLIPGGQLIGLSLADDRVTVAAFDEAQSPAQQAGLQVGDVLTHLDGHPVSCAADIRSRLAQSNGTVALSIQRKGKNMTVQLQPAITTQGPRLGIYLKQDITGVGTLTYYDPQNGDFGALGHCVNDSSGKLLRSPGGTAYDAAILRIRKGQCGKPGQLLGAMHTDQILGTLNKNTPQGVFGNTQLPLQGTPLETAAPGQVHTGNAIIRSTVGNGGIQEYSVKILKIYPQSRSGGRNMLIQVTDPALLEATGGIVQGMSGSPIIQDGKLVGAVTHVLVNDPTTGYGIFIENMLDAAA